MTRTTYTENVRNRIADSEAHARWADLIRWRNTVSQTAVPPSADSSVVAGERARARALATIKTSCDRLAPEWRDDFLNAAVDLVNYRVVFSTEDVIDIVGHPRRVDLRASGPLMQTLQRAGLIEHAGMGRSKSPDRHRAPIHMWMAK